ncbi:GAP family protein [Streptomyces sp. NPDC008159]|uniref:GAP family protein n=1 Tax=Streptomyces sp. NPDC008159 TaxID=3364817 RepID=UPI0036EA5A69
MDGLQILPLAITMMVGPQIISAIIFVTTPRAVQVSLGFLVGIALATTAGVAVMMGLAAALDNVVDFGDPSDNGSVGHIIQYVLVALLAAAALKNWIKRESVEPPKWLGTLMNADPRKAFKVGLMVILVMPSDLVIMMTVGVNLIHSHASFVAALPFIGLTILVAALPLLIRMLFGHHAEGAMPKIRDWTNTHSWLVNIIVCVVFIILILA